MLDRELGADIAPKNRAQFLRDNCDKIEEMSYAKPIEAEELEQKRVELERVSINISDLNQQKKDYNDAFKMEMDPLNVVHKNIIKDLKEKSVQVTENCFVFVDEESRMAGYYSADGVLRYTRPATANEMQKTVQMEMRRTGTNN